MTSKQERFVYEYLLDFNATQAAIRAGYSAKTARSIGQENLTKPDIAEAIAEGQRQAAEKAECTLIGHLEQLAKIRDLAIIERNLSAANSAEHNRGKVAGFYIDRHESGKPGEFDNLTDEQLDEREAELDREIAELEARAPTGQRGQTSATRH